MDKNSGHIGLKFACGFCNNSGLRTYVSKYREVKFLIFSLKNSVGITQARSSVACLLTLFD